MCAGFCPSTGMNGESNGEMFGEIHHHSPLWTFKLNTIEVTMHCLLKHNNVPFQILQGREFLWSISNATLRLAILETISRCDAPNRAGVALPQ
jgi:hypothetical protein